jgi:hypothetical protein
MGDPALLRQHVGRVVAVEEQAHLRPPVAAGREAIEEEPCQKRKSPFHPGECYHPHSGRTDTDRHGRARTVEDRALLSCSPCSENPLLGGLLVLESDLEAEGFKTFRQPADDRRAGALIVEARPQFLIGLALS